MKNETEEKVPEYQTWLQDIVIENTPKWAHFIAMIAMWRGMRWMHYFPLPLIRYFTDFKIKKDQTVKDAGKGFRKGTLTKVDIFRVYKRGRLIAEKEFKTMEKVDNLINKKLMKK